MSETTTHPAQGAGSLTASARPSWRSRDVGVRMLWRAARGWTSAGVVAAFPALFVLDGRVEWAMSPVLPGLVFLVAVLAVFPIGLFELWVRAHRRLGPDARDRRATRLRNGSRIALGVAWAWFAAWLVWGA